MAEAPQSEDFPQPLIVAPGRWRLSLVWLVPLIAALVGLGLVLRSYLQAGPTITISFKSAEGIAAGQTEVRYKDVVIGRVRDIALSKDHTNVIVSVELKRSEAALAVEDTRFWVVRPRADLGGVSGLGTLLSGAYLGVDLGRSATQRREFVGLEVPPRVTSDQEGARFVLRADDLGSLNIGSPVYYRRIPVGSVVGFDLAEQGRGVSIEVFVQSPYDQYVTEDCRFWNASGLDLSVDAAGVKLNTQSLLTMVAGGIAFRSLADAGDAPAAEAAEFRLYDDESSALAPPDGPALAIIMRFYQSTRGLAVGAPIDFQGTELGKVRDIHLRYDAQRTRFATEVIAELYPQRLGSAIEILGAGADGGREALRLPVKTLIDRGLRGQLRLGNLITGQLYVALDFLPRVPATLTAQGDARLEIPTAPASLEEIQSQAADIVRKLNEIPYGDIGRQLVATLETAQKLLRDVDTEVAPELRRTLDQAQDTLSALDRGLIQSDSPTQTQTREALQELERAARSLRGLSDYLQRHPEALLRGRRPEAEASQAPPPRTP